MAYNKRDGKPDEIKCNESEFGFANFKINIHELLIIAESTCELLILNKYEYYLLKIEFIYIVTFVFASKMNID